MTALQRPALQEDATLLAPVLDEVIASYAEAAPSRGELSDLDGFAAALRERAPIVDIRARLRRLSRDGHLHGALVVMASALRKSLWPELGILLVRELLDALAPELGIQLARAILASPDVDARKLELDGAFCQVNLLLGETLLERGDPQGALRHFEAVLATDVDQARALLGFAAAVRELDHRGAPIRVRSRGLALVDGIEQLESGAAIGLDRYELICPLGRGRHAIVYRAYDRRVGREVAIKRLLGEGAIPEGASAKLVDARFFAEARTLARVRSPYVIALLDVQPKHRFVALELCRGGNLRMAMRRGLLGGAHLDDVGSQLRQALTAVHVAGAVHRDVKPANLLVRAPREGSPIALADFGLAIHGASLGQNAQAGTLRYMAPELRRGGLATPASDLFSAGVVLLELATTPKPLPDMFDRMDPDFDAASVVPDTLPGAWSNQLRTLLSIRPEERTWIDR